MKRLRVLMTRQEIESIGSGRLPGATVVVIDVFLATTTLLVALENGARSVYPVATLEEAEELRGRLDGGRILRGGEQGAERIEGYDLGPYPEEYAPDVVAGKDVVFVTTNGTRAIGAAAGAGELLLGCLRNAPAVARHLEESGAESVYVVCSGSEGRFVLEDFLGAAAILSRLDEGGYLDGWRLNDAARLALDLAGRYVGREAEVLEEGRAGRWFVENGMMEAFAYVADVGASEVVPEVVDGRLWHGGNTESVGDRHSAKS